MKRLFDIFVAVILFPLIVLPMLCIALIIKITSKGPVIYWSDRVGQYNKIFHMPKFRTMKVDTPAKATHLLDNPDSYLIPLGKLIRTTSLDELPQLYSILRGDMTFVGPRPALFNQDDLIALRTERGIHRLKPGLTGWAQVNGRDDLPIPVKVDFDEYYMKNVSIFFDIKIILLTFVRVVRREGVTH